jgi:D-glycero-alpha-D-manno-heptose-7-phosphate kinase
MTKLTDFSISDSATMEDAIALIQKNGSRCVVVLGAAGKVVGAFSEGDVLRAILAGVDVHTPLKSLIKPSFRYLRRRDLVAARKLFLEGITLLPILDKNFELLDVLTMSDVFEH